VTLTTVFFAHKGSMTGLGDATLKR